MASEREIVIDKRREPEYGCIVTADGVPMVITGEPGEEALLMEKRLKSEEQYGLFLRLVRCWALMEKRRHSRAMFSDLEVSGHSELGSVGLTCLPVDGEEGANMWLVLDVSILDHFLALTTQTDDVCFGLAGVGRADQLIVMDKWDSTKIGIRLGLSEFVGLFHDQIEAIENMLVQQEEKTRK
ncbi:hypothetical protein A3A84_01140 [Candidatus Collierbacteria bacterium RIFCSPLOWO2_01_FULL_50_23]|uniref:Uncharacterized protein n=2 Tax=Candidatus Collieribacteriota TaxID=1752725 RepID=A0A1F5ESX3_9BACT|nr:MAG: hypothetical protein A3D09_00750 [Candidatus Collierbacteria bacterium RIFCSPHIGHO2_02_FULL_49_10]OGD72411.1 MAG: hypothetical protein A2703_00325 [Candidatus Collierbacteria bacterium RIFCSPHIGHO2_01_FULL_50_25]OGD74265.1 MAG: hypothetical protein A3A84_01140 [Candidatus Collierbacteria bacterium RIFCSPLOWO2_01_FULL_50_23]